MTVSINRNTKKVIATSLNAALSAANIPLTVTQSSLVINEGVMTLNIKESKVAEAIANVVGDKVEVVETETTPNAIEFQSGEKTKLKQAYREAIKTVTALKMSFFGAHLTLKETNVMVIGYNTEKSRVIVRKENGKNTTVATSTIVKAIEASAPDMETEEKAQTSSSITITDKSQTTPATTDKATEMAFKSGEKTGMKKAYREANRNEVFAKLAMKNFSQVIQLADEKVMIVGLDVEHKKVIVRKANGHDVKQRLNAVLNALNSEAPETKEEKKTSPISDKSQTATTKVSSTEYSLTDEKKNCKIKIERAKRRELRTKFEAEAAKQEVDAVSFFDTVTNGKEFWKVIALRDKGESVRLYNTTTGKSRTVSLETVS